MRDDWKSRWYHWFREELPAKAWIEVVGSGGKTTLVNELARLFAAAGRRVVITTSTHMYPIPGLWQPWAVTQPQNNSQPHSSIQPQLTLQPGEVVQLGTSAEQDKIASLSEQDMTLLPKMADIILVEADGSKRLPLKYPAEHEPVLSDRRTHTIIVQGLSALGRSAAGVCHRHELAKQRQPQLFRTEQVTIADMAELMRSGYRRVYEQGRTVILLNQADCLPSEDQGDLLTEYRACLGDAEPAVEMIQLEDEGAEKERPRKQPMIGLILMASGFSRRFGEDKLSYEVEGRSLAEHALELMRAVMRLLWQKRVKVTACVVSRQRWLRDRATALGIQAVDNPYSEEGISASIRIGTQQVCTQGVEKLLFLVADQPRLRADTVWQLIEAALTEKQGLVIPQCDDRSGNPCIFDRRYREELLALQGEQGGKTVIRRHPDDCLYVSVPKEALADIDNKEQINNIIMD
ncbi:MAG: selenium cofactor biosynthesis protein YqeC [Eubacteriales bacterium]|nr:selenium cofactor biosynthesis protein YqeC [Eubacteriales bacterium]